MTSTAIASTLSTPPKASERLSPKQAQEALSEPSEQKAFLLDVRGYGEFAAAHAAGATCIPLPDLERRAGELPTDRAVLCICASGHRSQMAVGRLRSLGMNNVRDIVGGTNAWKAAGLPVQKQSGVIPLERQVRGVAGTLVFIFSVLGFTVSPAFYGGAAFIGFMLMITALLGICPMMSVLRIMPWNRVAPASPEAPSCAVRQ